MDNCVKNNKNCHLLMFLSLLITCEVLEVQLGFLVVKHTHEDIDESFGYLLKKLKKKKNYVMADLMKTFMFSQNHPFIPQFIQEILDFKYWVNGYLNNGPDIFVSHMEMHLFWFFMDKIWWLVMKYKVFPINVLWSPKDGLTI